MSSEVRSEKQVVRMYKNNVLPVKKWVSADIQTKMEAFLVRVLLLSKECLNVYHVFFVVSGNVMVLKQTSFFANKTLLFLLLLFFLRFHSRFFRL